MGVFLFLFQDIIQSLDVQIGVLKRNLIINICLMLGALIMFPTIVYLVYRLTRKLQSFTNSLCDKTFALDKERKRTEQLLYQMLPIATAKRMMRNLPVIPEHYDSVTIFFSDIVGFTTICSRSSPMEVIHMLNSLYSMVDEHLESFDVYKVETIGNKCKLFLSI